MPATDPRFLAATALDMAIDWWCDHYSKNPNGTIEDEDEDFSLDKVLKAFEENPDDWETVINDGTT